MSATMIFLLVSLLMPTEGIVTQQVWAPAKDTSSASPDGRYLSYINWTTGNLAVHDLETGENRDVTDEGSFGEKWQYSDFSTWSPDSRQLAYCWLNGDAEELRIVDLEGSRPRVLASSNSELGIDAPWPREWSQDGKYILAILNRRDESQERGYENQIVLVSVADASLRVLKSLGKRHTRMMSLSPDGRYVAYELEEAPGSIKRDIHLLATDGSGEAPLVEHPADDSDPFWAPDGKRIVFVSDRSGTKSVWMLDVENGKPKGAPTLAKTMDPYFGPMGFGTDGTFYYRVGIPRFDIYTATLDFEAGEVLSPPTKMSLRYEGSNYAPFWSRDGKYLAYASMRSPGNSRNVLVIRSVNTGEVRDLTPKTGSVLFRKAFEVPQWSPDGSSILLTGFDQGMKTPCVYLLDPETANVTLIVPDEPQEGGKYAVPKWPVFSNDGKQIYYIRDYRTIVARDLETHQETELYQTSTSNVRNLALSPDGRRLAFFEAENLLRPTVVKTMSTAGGEPSELHKLENGDSFARGAGLAWTPDGRYVVVGGPDDPDKPVGELWSIPSTGGEPIKLNLGVNVRNLNLHPDGQRIAYTHFYPKGGAEIWTIKNFLP